MSESPQERVRRVARRASEELAESLTEVCHEALICAGFPPSEQLLDKLNQEISNALALR